MAEEVVTTPPAGEAAATTTTPPAGEAAAAVKPNVPVAEPAEGAASKDAKEGDGPTQESEDGKADEDKTEGAPETYEPFVLPEGMEADGEAIGEFQAIAKELNLSQASAQKLIDLQAKVVAAGAEASQKAFATVVTGWLEDARNDKEIGGTKFDETINTAKAGIEAFAGDHAGKFREMLSLSGLGNHPEMIRYLAAVGKAVSDDSIHLGRTAGAGGAPKTPEQKLYPTMFQQE